MPSFVFVTLVPGGALPSVFVASNNFSPYGVSFGTFGGVLGGPSAQLKLWHNCFAKIFAVVWSILPRDSKSPMPGGRVFHTPEISRLLYGIPGTLNLASSLCCAGVRQCGQVFHPAGGNSVCANAAVDRPSIHPSANATTVICRVVIAVPFLRRSLRQRQLAAPSIH